MSRDCAGAAVKPHLGATHGPPCNLYNLCSVYFQFCLLLSFDSNIDPMCSCAHVLMPTRSCAHGAQLACSTLLNTCTTHASACAPCVMPNMPLPLISCALHHDSPLMSFALYHVSKQRCQCRGCLCGDAAASPQQRPAASAAPARWTQACPACCLPTHRCCLLALAARNRTALPGGWGSHLTTAARPAASQNATHESRATQPDDA